MSAENALYEFADARIIDRGRDYFLSGKVISITRSDDFMFEAKVEGNSIYTVEVGFDTDEFTLFQWDCDCPYEGNLCKHVAAVVFQIAEDPEVIQPEITPPEAPTVHYTDSVEEILGNIPFEKLKTFVRSATAEDRNLAKKFFLLFPEYLSVLPKKYFADKIHEIINSYSGGHTFLQPKATSSALKDIRKMFDSVQKQSRKNGFANLITCATEIISTLTELSYRFGYADSEARPIMFSAEIALKEIAYKAAKDNVLRQQMLDMLIEQISENSHPERESYRNIVALIAKLVNSKSEINRLISIVNNNIVPMNLKEQQLKILLSLIEKFKDESEVLSFLAKHWEYPVLREEKINSALKAKDFKQAAFLAEEGIKATPANNNKLIATWYYFLLKTAITRKENEKILNLAVQTISRAGLVYKIDFYAMVKKYIGHANWNQFVETLISELQTSPANFDIIAQIYIRERWEQRLLGHLMLKPELKIISDYDDFLSTEFREELSLLYAGAITFKLQEAKSRGDYREILSYLKKVKKFGGKSSAIALKDELLQKFYQRAVLLEELKKVRV